MSKDDDKTAFVGPVEGLVAESLYVTAAGGVINSALIAMLASADAFAARLITATGQSAHLSAVQARGFAKDVADLTSGPPIVATRDTDVDRTIIDRGPPPGAPVVT